MKIKSLLAAVSMVAIAAGSASALSITNVAPSGIVPALELELPGIPPLTGAFAFDVITNAGSTFPGGNNLKVKVELPAGVYFSTAVNGGDITGAANSATVQNGSGTVGSSVVEFLAAIPQPATNTLTFNFNLGLNTCPIASSPLKVSITTEDGTAIETGSASSLGLIAPCKSAIDGVILSDVAKSDTKITLASGYTSLAEFPGTGPLNVAGVVGTAQYSIDPLVSKSLTAVVPMTIADVAAVKFDVMFEDAAGIDKVFINGIPTVKSGNNFTMTATTGIDKTKMFAGPNSILVVPLGTVVIPTQNVWVGNSKVTFRTTGAPDLIAEEMGPMGSLDALQREGREFGFFDWNGGTNGTGTISVYRITGLTGPTDFTIQLENSNANGTYAGQVVPDATGEAQLTSNNMGGALPAGVVRYDVQINLETPNTNVDVDRLMIRNGIVTNYGDGANATTYGQPNQPNSDSDDNLGSE